MTKNVLLTTAKSSRGPSTDMRSVLFKFSNDKLTFHIVFFFENVYVHLP